MAVANLEARIPFTGLEKLALIPFQYLPSDLNFFRRCWFGLVKTKKIEQTYPYESFRNNTISFKTSPIFTIDINLIINVLDYLVWSYILLYPYTTAGNSPSLQDLILWFRGGKSFVV
jgi:hypothetical protein